VVSFEVAIVPMAGLPIATVAHIMTTHVDGGDVRALGVPVHRNSTLPFQAICGGCAYLHFNPESASLPISDGCGGGWYQCNRKNVVWPIPGDHLQRRVFLTYHRQRRQTGAKSPVDAWSDLKRHEFRLEGDASGVVFVQYVAKNEPDDPRVRLPHPPVFLDRQFALL
jgi:hypothetical protein